MLPKNSKILVIGGSIKGQGMDSIYSSESFEIVGSDVSFGPYTKIVLDAHDIPFEDEVFDCVIIQAVLEHVIDPQRCVNEIHRVLKPSGIVYAETPFIQQVHMRQYDFKYLSKINCALLGGGSSGATLRIFTCAALPEGSPPRNAHQEKGSRGSRGRGEKDLLLHLKNIQINLFIYLQDLLI